VLEIGFGMGQATAHIAALRPDTLFIGCEVHEPGVGALLKLVDALQLPNDAHHPARRGRGAAAHGRPGTLDGIHIFFPDPGPRSATTSAA
jgi:tRNA (guanine-N7-)-methyltransferase